MERSTERTRLLDDQRSIGSSSSRSRSSDKEQALDTADQKTAPGFMATVVVLLIGVFISNADTALALANYGTIASEFDRLEDASWLVTSYMLGLCSTQGMYGKFSDIWGRKNVLLFSYMVFGGGCLIVGLKDSFSQVIVGRVILGIGAAGMTCVVSILITDLVPLREVASWRSYVYVAATAGRSAGSPLGGFLADTIGWRWSFTGQFPLAMLSFGLVWWKLHVPATTSSFSTDSRWTKLRSIDFPGAVFLACSITCLLLILDVAGTRYTWDHPFTISLLAVWISTGLFFIIAEAFWAAEPIFPLRLLTKRDVVTAYLIQGLGTGAQLAMISTIAIYFRVTKDAYNSLAALHIVPQSFAHAFGGLSTGYIINRTGRYKLMIVVSTIFCSLCYTLLVARWTGDTNWLESSYVLLGGLGTGIANTAVFVGLTASVGKHDIAIVASGNYVCDNLGVVLGVSAANAVKKFVLKETLNTRLEGFSRKEDYIRAILTSIDSLKHLPEAVHQIAVATYVLAIRWSNGLALLASLTALTLGVGFLKEYPLTDE